MADILSIIFVWGQRRNAANKKFNKCVTDDQHRAVCSPWQSSWSMEAVGRSDELCMRVGGLAI